MKQKTDTPIEVTSCLLPPLEEYLSCVKDIFNSHWLTNGGRYVLRLERELKNYLDAPCLSLCANGTLALQLSLRLLGLNGKKVILTPFTYVATLTALLWEGCQPVFADIDSQTLCIDPEKVERTFAEHPDAAGVLPVQVYGGACDVVTLDAICSKAGAVTLYDAAHAFGSKLYGKSLLDYGAASTCSFHATKLFHTVEGGCIVTSNQADTEQLELLRAFGHKGDDYYSLGINAKMSELHAAMGLCLLPRVGEVIAARATLCAAYDEALDVGDNLYLRRPRLIEGLEWNYAYYPVIFASPDLRQKAQVALTARNIRPRRYFHPSLSKLPYVKTPACPVAEDMAERVLCLPLWADMPGELPAEIAAIILAAMTEA